jgi:Mrp family chromosome partitioning ATPase
VPFIEVGGRGRKVEASPSVLLVPLPKSSPDYADSASKQRIDLPSSRMPVPASGGQRGFSFRASDAAAPAKAARIASEILAFHDEANPVSEQYRTLLARIQETLPAGATPVLLFTAIAPGAGTTTMLLNLAVTWSRHGKQRVVVVDANLTRPAVASRLGMVPAMGLAEVLSGSAGLERALIASAQPDLHILAATTSPHGREVLAEENVRWLAARLRERFDVVLVDGPAWESSGDRAALAAVADVIYLVVEAADADTPAVHKVTRTLAQRGWRLGGLIIGQ